MVQELLQHAMLNQGQLLDSEVEALCQPLLSRVVPACLQSNSTLAEGSAGMVSSQMLNFCAQHAGAVMIGLLGSDASLASCCPVPNHRAHSAVACIGNPTAQWVLNGFGTAFTEVLKPLLAATSSAGDKQPAVKRLLELLDIVLPSADQQMISTNVVRPLAAAAWEAVFAAPSSSTGPALLGALMARLSPEGIGGSVTHGFTCSSMFCCPIVTSLEVLVQMVRLPTWAFSSLPLVH